MTIENSDTLIGGTYLSYYFKTGQLLPGNKQPA